MKIQNLILILKCKDEITLEGMVCNAENKFPEWFGMNEMKRCRTFP